MRPEPGDKVTIRYTFTLPETEPADGFKLPPTPLDQVNTIIVRERDAATRDDKPGTVRRMRDSGVLVVKRETHSGWPWVSLDATVITLGAYTDKEVCGNSDYVGAVPGSEADTRQVRVWVDSDSEQYWFEFAPGKLTWGSGGHDINLALSAALRRYQDPAPRGLRNFSPERLEQEYGGWWTGELVTLP
jgi:hypothetical protein